MKPPPALAFLIVLLALCTLATATAARTWYVKVDGTGDVPTIQAAIDVADPGDVILVAAGRYTWANQGGGSPPHAMIHIGRYRDGFTLRSESGPEATIIDAQRQGRGFFIDGFNNIEIDGFTITGGLAPAFGDHTGGGIAAAHTADVIKNCIFENNEARVGGGLFLGGHGTVRIENCVFRNNTAEVNGGGLWFAYSPLGFDIVDCQIYNNTSAFGGGIFAIQAALTIENTVIVNNTATVEGGAFYGRALFPSFMNGCTVSSNEAPDGSAVYLIAGSPVGIERTIFSFNGAGTPISLLSGAAPTVGCCDLFGNSAGDALPAGAIDNGHNISADPGFCNPPWWHDPTLDANSPCLPGNHPDGADCGMIGARQVNCNTVPVEKRTWGHIKALFR
jgi:hypothetical protein